MRHKSNYRDYGPEDKAACLSVVDACGGNVARASRETGVPERTLRHWYRQDAGLSEDAAKLADVKKLDLAQVFEDHALKAMGLAAARVDDPETSYADTIRGAAIAVDKMRLLREQPTSIATTKVAIEERAGRLADELISLGLFEVGSDSGDQPTVQ